MRAQGKNSGQFPNLEDVKIWYWTRNCKSGTLLGCLDFPNKIPCLHAKLRIPFFTVLQIRFFKMAGDFFIWQAKIRIAKMIMSRGLEPQWGLREKIQDNFLILKMSKFDIGLETAKVEPLILKMKIWSPCIDCLVKTLITKKLRI